MSTYIKILQEGYQGMQSPVESSQIDERLAELNILYVEVEHYPTFNTNFIEVKDASTLPFERIMELLHIDDYVEVSEEDFLNGSNMTEMIKQLNF